MNKAMSITSKVAPTTIATINTEGSVEVVPAQMPSDSRNPIGVDRVEGVLKRRVRWHHGSWRYRYPVIDMYVCV